MSQWGGSIFSSKNMGVILQLDVPVKVSGQQIGNINHFQEARMSSCDSMAGGQRRSGTWCFIRWPSWTCPQLWPQILNWDSFSSASTVHPLLTILMIFILKMCVCVQPCHSPNENTSLIFLASQGGIWSLQCGLQGQLRLPPKQTLR